MLVDHLLPAFAHQYHHEAVKAGDHSPELEAVHQKKCYGHFFPAHFIENGIL